MNAITIGVAALAAGQRGMAVTGQNIANASTPGYRRQGVFLASRETAGEASGVDVVRITRFEAPPLRAAILRGNSEESALAARLDSQRQVEVALGQPPSDLSSLISGTFDSLDRLATRPNDDAARREFFGKAEQLTARFNAAYKDIGQLHSDVRRSIVAQVDQVNGLTSQIAELNGQIFNTEVEGQSANELRDRRDQLIDDLSKIIDFRVIDLPNGVVNLVAKDTTLVVSEVSTKLAAGFTPDGKFEFRTADDNKTIQFSGGSLKGLQDEYNTYLPRTLDRLDALANSIAEKFDTIQATGLGTNGPRTQVVGSRRVDDPAAILDTQNLGIPIRNGQLTISVTDTATGNRTNSIIAIDPSTQSLDDLASAISTATGGLVTASVDVPQNILRIQSLPGYAFDFAGRVATAPTTNSLSGTATPTLDGALQSTGSDTFTFTAIGSGTVGTTPGLQLEVRNSANVLVTTIDVGEGYVPGTPLSLGNGLTVKLSAGTVTGGNFTADATGSPDTAGVLAGLGVNSLFSGTGAGEIRVRPEFANSPALLATSRNGQPGDTSNLKRFTDLRNQPLIGGQSARAEATDIASEVGTQIRTLDDRRSSQAAIVQNLFAQEQAMTGVDVNEEVVKLLDFQRMITAAARYISVVNEALDEIVQLVR